MPAVMGRPRQSCGTCKLQKIRCTKERPRCTRCARLDHLCVYENYRRAPREAMAAVAGSTTSDVLLSPTPEVIQEVVPAPTTEVARATDINVSNVPGQGVYHGIPRSLLLELVGLYYDNVYNASLLLHRRLFLDAISDGTAQPHVVLSVCASAANFYRDAKDQPSLNTQGFMAEWAGQAGKLVLKELESVHEDNIVTHVVLSLFWHSQGDWRKAYLHKGCACNLLRIIGFGYEGRSSVNTFAGEVRRRRFWACYLAHCHTLDCTIPFEPAANLENLALPWPDDDFDAGVSYSPPVTLASGESNGGTYSEIIKILTLWTSVVATIKASKGMGARVSAIHELDESLSYWWHKLRPEFQAKCALHASIVPIFCWGAGDETWLSARQLSAQTAYEHACAGSSLLIATSSRLKRVSVLPSFVSYAAYCGCAIQIPFMWSQNPVVKKRACINVRANAQLIHSMAEYWKFAALLKIYVRCLYNGHKRHPVALDDEPKILDPVKLVNFNVMATNAQESILDFNAVLSSKGGGIARVSEEAGVNLGNPGPTRESRVREQQAPHPLSGNASNLSSSNSIYPSEQPEQPEYRGQIRLRPEQHRRPQVPVTNNMLTALASDPCNPADVDSPTPDIFQSQFDSEILGLLPQGEIPDLSQFATSPFNLDYLDIGDWNQYELGNW